MLLFVDMLNTVLHDMNQVFTEVALARVLFHHLFKAGRVRGSEAFVDDIFSHWLEQVRVDGLAFESLVHLLAISGEVLCSEVGLSPGEFPEDGMS